MTKLVKSISSDLFSFNGTHFLGEYSTIHGNSGQSVPARIFDDACDYGFVMKSERTGEEAVFGLKQRIHDENGDLSMEEYSAYHKGVTMRAIIFND